MINRKILTLVLASVIILIALLALVLLGREDQQEQYPFGEPSTVPVGQGSLKGKALSPDKEVIKSQLVIPIGDAGVLAETSEFRIEYYSPDVFQVEIKTANIADARASAINWFKEQGFNEEDICKLPVTFYLNPEVARKLEGSGVIFNTLPDFCQ